MQNLLGNILSFMDVYEKSQSATDTNDYIVVVEQLGRAIRRTIIFDSMVSEGNPMEEENVRMEGKHPKVGASRSVPIV